MRNTDLAVFCLRLALGIIFAAHGSQKLFGAFGGPGIEGVVQMMKGMKFASPETWAWILSLSEFLGGIFVFLGILPRLGAGVIAVVMAVAILKVHLPHGLFMAQGGFEYPFVLFMVSVSIVLTGGGRFSVFNKF